MKSPLRFLILALSVVFADDADALKPRIVFEKYLFAEGVNPKARNLDRLMVKYFDEDMVRLRDGKLVSTNGRNTLDYTQDFLSRHMEIQLGTIIRSMTEEAYEAMIAENEQKAGVDLIDLFSFYCFQLPEPADDPKALLADILRAPEVEIAYYEPIPVEACSDYGFVTPDFTGDQQYHDPAPLGLDYDYANGTFGEDADGNNTWWVGIQETGFTLDHEDLENHLVATAGSWTANGTHGTAVTGIIGACDDNGIGCIGFVGDEVMRLYNRQSDAYGSRADVYTFMNDQLIEGEVSNHSWGFIADPLPEGQDCPCNEDQNGAVPLEYDPSLKAAVQNGTAEGIHYLLAAHNGCVNLDDPIFGNTFRWSTDTWSIYVGAVNGALNGSVHDAACFTDYGEKVTINAWGNSVRSHGYGTSWPPDSTDGDPREWYCWFSGTSSATPIVCGATGTIQYLWWQRWNNTYLHPQTMRTLLAYLGTPPGTTPGNIGVMPNLLGILGPNLEPHWQADGWDSPIVPRQVAGATFDNVQLNNTLLPEPSLTYLNWNVVNESLFKEAEPAKFSVYMDDELLVTATDASLNYATWDYRLNHSVQIGGGRHTLTNRADHLNELVEGDETDNDWVESYAWNPTPLSNQNLLHSYPPKPYAEGQVSPYRNRDGFRNDSPGQWKVAAIMCEGTNVDYDISVYDEVPSSTFGYENSEADGALSGDRVDIVGRNANNMAGEDLLGVTKNNSTSTDDYRIHAVGSHYVGTPGPGRNLVASETFTTSELLYAIEFNVNALVAYTVELEYLSGDAEIVGELFEPNLGYFYGNLSSEYFYANVPGYGWLEHFTPTQLGRHCLIIHKYSTDDWSQTAEFNVYLGKSQPDLAHVQSSNWPNPIVITQSISVIPPAIPALLIGNQNTNYVHSQYTNIGGIANPPGVVNDEFRIDTAPVLTTGEWSSWDPGDTTYWSNQGTFFVRGGRHTITDIIDINNELAEWYEDNNRWDEQYVWTPFTMSLDVAYSSPAAPNGRDNDAAHFFVDENCDGWSWRGLPPPYGHWTGASMCGVDASDWYDLVLYQNMTSATEGFDETITGSQADQGKVQFVVINDDGFSEEQHEVGVFNRNDYPEQPSSGRYWIRAEMGQPLQEGCNGPFTLGAGGPELELFDIYEIELQSGEDYAISVDNLSIDVNLNIGVYPPSPRYASRSYGGDNAENTGMGGDETVYYTPSITGTHAVVVYRDAVEDLPFVADYLLQIGPRVPFPPTELTLVVLDNLVDPILMRADWDSSFADTNLCPVEVDTYRVYATEDDQIAFDPNTWVLVGSTQETFLEFDVPASIGYFRMVVVAEDWDALVPPMSNENRRRFPTKAIQPRRE